MGAVSQLQNDWRGQSFSWNETPVPLALLHLAQEIDAAGSPGFLLANGITSNATGLLGSVPANAFFLRLLLRNTTANSVNVTLGSTSGGSDIAPASGNLTVPANGTLTVDINNFLIGWLSAAATQAIYLASASWGGASVNAKLDFEVGP